MKKLLSSDDLHKVARYVQEHIGFYYASDRLEDLNRGFLSACQDLGYSAPGSCLELIKDPVGSTRLEEILVKKLTIGETYFFRDKRLFWHLRDTLLPDLIRERRSGRKYLRIWCAACSSGEEPYSIAMLLQYLLPDIDDWEITLLATDINAGSLHAAQRGVYSRWSFREEAPIPTDPYVSPAPDGRFQISADIRQMVRFSRLNLITDQYPSILNGTTTMDLVICRNVLMYFVSDLAEKVIDRLNESLISGGWLVVSPQEISYAQRPGLMQVKQSSVFLFRKGTRSTEKQEAESLSLKPEILPALLSSSQASYPLSLAGSDAITSVLSSVSGKSDSVSDAEQPSLNLQSSAIVPLIPLKLMPDSLISSGELTIHEDPLTLIRAGRLFDAEFILMKPDHQSLEHIADMEMLARIFADQGDVERAFGWCDRILGIDPLYAGAYHLRAVIYQDQENFTAAIQSLRQALYADPDYLPAHLMLGMILRTQGKAPDARRHYQVALQLLSAMADDTPVDKTDGMPAARVREMVTVLLNGVAVS